MQIDKKTETDCISDNFHDLYLELLGQHLQKYEYKNSPRGLAQRERIATRFVLSNPVERCVLSKYRKSNIFFQYAEFLWYLSGDDKLDFLEYYSPQIKKFSQDGIHLNGTAYGKKIFLYNDVVNQWKCSVEELKRDSNSRRAVIVIFDPREMLIENNIDLSCTLALQFLLRNEQLHMITTMRSNDVFTGMVSDIFSFTMMQELMANELGVKVGNYYHQVGSSHLYEEKIEKVEKILEYKQKFCEYQLEFPQMPRENNWKYIEKILQVEKSIRQGDRDIEINTIKDSLPKYWKDVVTLFEIFRLYKFEGKVEKIEDYVHSLHPMLQFLVKIKCF